MLEQLLTPLIKLPQLMIRTHGAGSFTDLSQLLSDGGEAFVLRLGVCQDIARLSQLCLQLLHALLVIRLLTGRLLDERLLAALAVSRHLPVVGVRLSERLRNRRYKN